MNFLKKLKTILMKKCLLRRIFSSKDIRTFLIVRLIACDDFQTMKHQTKKQILVDIPIIRENPLYSLSF